MNLNNKYLDEWLKEYKNEYNDFRDFPLNYDYPTQYKNFSNKLEKWIHPFVVQGAMLSGDGVLSDHGPEHIKTVIKRATQLVVNMKEEDRLSPYEVYILLMAIQIHDVGNIIKRRGHEEANVEIINKLIDPLIQYDKIEWVAIFDIASAHGGEVKDKISKLPENDPIHNFPIRYQLLAAILKFADELAEDFSRAARYLSQHIQFPEFSKLYHEYAASLHSVLVKTDSRIVSMHFNLSEESLHKTFKKQISLSNGDKEIQEQHLINEIFLRTLKTHYERLYCMRFLRPFINIDRVRVSIKVTCNDITKKFPEQGYDLIETGINDIHMEQIFEMCPELEALKGETFSKKVKKFTNQ